MEKNMELSRKGFLLTGAASALAVGASIVLPKDAFADETNAEEGFVTAEDIEKKSRYANILWQDAVAKARLEGEEPVRILNPNNQVIPRGTFATCKADWRGYVPPASLEFYFQFVAYYDEVIENTRAKFGKVHSIVVNPMHGNCSVDVQYIDYVILDDRRTLFSTFGLYVGCVNRYNTFVYMTQSLEVDFNAGGKGTVLLP